MKTPVFYLLIFAPMFAMVFFLKDGSLSAANFGLLLALYCIAYHPTVVGLRLLSKHVISKADFAKTYIPFWNQRFFAQAFS